jgi:hypothetical protein
LDENKKPGPRDISDLKARLGLKKPQAGAAAAPAGTPPAGQPVVAQAPSPFAQQPSAPSPFARQAPSNDPPPPFGRPAEAAPQPAPPPDPRRDPFAAQQQAAAANLAAFYGLGQQLPGSADATAGEPLEKKKPWGSIGLIAGAALIVFGVGNACGSISTKRSAFNETTEQAGQIRDEVDKISKQVTSVLDTLNNSAATRKGDIDLDVTQKLGALDLKKPDTMKIFHTNYASLEPIIVERLFTYYDNTIKLFDAIQNHVKKTENDKDAIQRFMTSGAGKSDKNYGVVVEQQGPIMLAKFVEVGSPVCTDPSKTDCNANELKGFKYRMDSGAGWGERPIKGKPDMIVMPIQQSPLFKSVASGNPDVLAVKDYARRMAEIRLLAGMLQNEQKDVVSDLKKAAEREHLLAL